MPQFNGPKLWSPNSSDLNPVDCRDWGCHAGEGVSDGYTGCG